MNELSLLQWPLRKAGYRFQDEKMKDDTFHIIDPIY